MHKTIFISFLIPVLINFLVGCYSKPVIDPDDNAKANSTNDQRVAGAKVFIIMNDGEEYTGELLIVRDSTMLLCKEYEASEEDLTDLVHPFYSVQNHDIIMIELKGESHIIVAILFGILTGFLAGVTIAFGYDIASPAPVLFVVGIGMLIGGIIGVSNTTYDEVVYEYANPEEYDFTKLNIYSRYGGKEPEYLKKIK
jgi:hypothetical protein